MDHSNMRMQQHHKRQRVTATTETTVQVVQPTTNTNTRIFKNRTATLAATTTEVSTTTVAATTAEETTRSTRRRPVLTSTDTSTPASSTSSTVAEDDEVTSAATQNTRNRGGTTTSNPTGSPAAGFNSATAINATPKNNESSSSNGGAIAGAIIAVIAVLAIGVGGYFVYRRRKNARAARGSGTGLIGGAGGSYKKQDEGNDSYGGNDGAGTFGATRDNSSLFGGREKTFSAESIGGAYGSTGGGGGGNNDWTQPTQQSSGPPASQYSSWNTPVAYPPSNQPLPASTANLLSNQPQSASTSNLLPASLAAGAAGIGATRLLQQQQLQPPPHQSTTEPFSTDSQYQSIEQRELQQELDNRRQSFMNKTQPPPPVPQISQQQQEEDESSPFGESEGQGEVREVKGTFDPSLDDELVLYPGDKVQVLMKYDDGWALGLNLSSGTPPSKGVFPFDCLGDIVPPPTSTEIRSASSPTPARSLSPSNPANIPLPPPTPTLLSPIGEDDQPPQSHQFSSGPPQLAPFERSDSPLSPDFPPSVHGNRNSLMLPGGGSPVKANGEKLKRHSSLIASRDADLFVALGEVLDKEKH